MTTDGDLSGLPQARGRERFEGPIGPGWRLNTWTLIVWTLVMGSWFVGAAIGAHRSRALNECLDKTVLSEDLCRAFDGARAFGVGLNMVGIATLWFAGFVVLSLIWIMVKLNHDSDGVGSSRIR